MAKYLIDTCSLIDFKRFYLPLEKKEIASDLIKNNFTNSKFFLLEAVYQECKSKTQQGEEKFAPLTKQKNETKPLDSYPFIPIIKHKRDNEDGAWGEKYKNFYIKNPDVPEIEFQEHILKKWLTEKGKKIKDDKAKNEKGKKIKDDKAKKIKKENTFDTQYLAYLKSADCLLILEAIDRKENGEDVIIMTQESLKPNDRKLFKKIPAICEIEEIKYITLQNYLLEERFKIIKGKSRTVFALAVGLGSSIISIAMFGVLNIIDEKALINKILISAIVTVVSITIMLIYKALVKKN